MVAIVVEREFKQQVSGADLHAAAGALRWCMNLYAVRPLVHYLGADGTRCACLFEAPDAEAIRAVLRTASPARPKHVWPATLHPGPGQDGGRPPDIADALVLTVVERAFPQPVSFGEVQALEDRGASCLEMHRVQFLRSYFSADRQRMLCMYQAPDVESVRVANRQVGLPFESAWRANVIEPAA
jgi:hypothetical protein